MASDTKSTRRRNRKLVFESLHSETGSWGGDAAAARVRSYCNDPEAAPREEFSYVGAVTLSRFYVDPDKPNNSERTSLWKTLQKNFGSSSKDPGGWDGRTNVSQLQAIVEES